MEKSINTFFILGLSIMLGCIDPIQFENPGSDPPYVIDGFISNLDGSYQVKVALSVPYSEESFLKPNFVPVINADVRIQDGLGNQVRLTHDSGQPGSYFTDPGFCGKVGVEYKVSIHLSNGKVIESDFEKTDVPAFFNRIITQFNNRPKIKNGIKIENPGQDILVEFNDDPAIDNYYLWRWYADYEVKKALDPIPCYMHVNDKDNIAVFSDAEQNGERLEEVVDFIEYRELVDISDRYLLSMEQHSISKRFYEYLNLINRQRSSQGSIFDPIPASIRGNLHYLNSDQTVLGYFSVRGIEIKRLSIPSIRTHYTMISNCEGGPIPHTCYDCLTIGGAKRARPEYY